MMRTTLAIALLWTALPLAAGADQFRDSVRAEPGGTLTIDLDRGSVDVETNGEDEVRVEASASGLGAGSVDFELMSDGRDARFIARSGGWSMGLFGGLRIRVVARVPERYSIKVDTGGGRIEIEEIDGQVEAKTSGGRITLDGATGDVTLRTSGGRISAENVLGDLLARTSGGPIRVLEVRGSVEVRTSGGRIVIDEVVGPVIARTSGGSITVRFDGDPEGVLETSGGSIDVEIPEGAGVDLDARTSGGRVVVQPEITISGAFRSNQMEGSINGGGPKLRLRTSGGNISVEER